MIFVFLATITCIILIVVSLIEPPPKRTDGIRVYRECKGVFTVVGVITFDGKETRYRSRAGVMWVCENTKKVPDNRISLALQNAYQIMKESQCRTGGIYEQYMW